MGQGNARIRVGDLVEVKPPNEILHTLDADGTLGYLPFMPEMFPFSGRRFRVQRVARKACIEYPGFIYRIREFQGDDVNPLKPG